MIFIFATVVTFMLPLALDRRTQCPKQSREEYLDTLGRSPFGVWFDRLAQEAAAKVTIAIARIEQGNFSNVKSVGAGVSEYKIDYGPGYRFYFGNDGRQLVILLGGGSKGTQLNDIMTAQANWENYKRRRPKRRRTTDRLPCTTRTTG